MDGLLQLYLVSGSLGFVYIMGSAALGFTHSAQDSGDFGGADGGDFGGADGGDAGNADGDFGSVDGGDLGGGTGSQIIKANIASFRTGTAPRRRQSLALLVLKLLSPSTIATFSFFFGLAGYLSLHYITFLGQASLALATICGIAGYKLMSRFTSFLVRRMHSSNSYSHCDVIGTAAEVTVPIAPGKLGEITYAAGGVRDTAPARAANDSVTLTASSKVMISDEKNGVFLVEPWKETGL